MYDAITNKKIKGYKMIQQEGKYFYVYIDTKQVKDFYIGRYATIEEAQQALDKAIAEDR